MVGVDEHAWRHTRRETTYVTAIIDLTPVRAGHARPRDMVAVRPEAAFEDPWRQGVAVVAMDRGQPVHDRHH